MEDSLSNHVKQEAVSEDPPSTTSSGWPLTVQDRLKALTINLNTGSAYSSAAMNSRFSADQTFMSESSHTQNEVSSSFNSQTTDVDRFVAITQSSAQQYSDVNYSPGNKQYQDWNQSGYNSGNQSHHLYDSYVTTSSSYVVPQTVSQYNSSISSNRDQNQSVIFSSQSQDDVSMNSVHNNAVHNGAIPHSTYKDNIPPSTAVGVHKSAISSSTYKDAVISPKHEPEEKGDDDDDEADILRAQLLKSVERRKKQKERLEVIYILSQ